MSGVASSGVRAGGVPSGKPFEAWWLPAGVGDAPLETLQVGRLECRYPVPTPALIDSIVRQLRSAGEALAGRPVESVVESLDAAAGRLADPRHPLRREADRVLTLATGYSPEMATLVLDRMSADWRAGPTRALLRAELGGPAVLDRFTAVDDGRRVRAYGPALAFHVFAGNVPGVAVTSLVRSLLVKAPSLGKLASGEPILPVLFARSLDSVDPDLARALAITYWPGGAGGSADAEGRVLEEADLVVVYGGPEAAASYRARLPTESRLVIHGPRFSAGLIGREALRDDPELPRRVARAIATFDQHGCVSPHAVWVEDPATDAAEDPAEQGGSAGERFAEALADALERLETKLPRGEITPAESSLIQQERGAAEIRGHTGTVRVLAGARTAWTVVFDRDPTFRASCLNRFVRVHPVQDLAETPALLAPVGHGLQSVAIAAPQPRRIALAHDLARIGATRVTSFDRLPWPPPQWHHDGRGPLRELLRWVDVED